MKIALFTNSIIYRDTQKRPYPLRDQFPHFISPLGKKAGHLTIVSREKKPVALYWTGPSVMEAVKLNYRCKSTRHRLARFVARREHTANVCVMKRAALHFFIDSNEYQLMGSPENVRWVVPNLISSKDIVSVSFQKAGRTLKIVFAARIFKHKGIYDLLNAVELLKKRYLCYAPYSRRWARN